MFYSPDTKKTLIISEERVIKTIIVSDDIGTKSLYCMNIFYILYSMTKYNNIIRMSYFIFNIF